MELEIQPYVKEQPEYKNHWQIDIRVMHGYGDKYEWIECHEAENQKEVLNIISGIQEYARLDYYGRENFDWEPYLEDYPKDITSGENWNCELKDFRVYWCNHMKDCGFKDYKAVYSIE